MTEDSTPFQHEHDPPRETMFGRLVTALQREFERQWDDAADQSAMDRDTSGNPDIVSFGTGGCLRKSSIVRALLTELRVIDETTMEAASKRSGNPSLYPVTVGDSFEHGIDAILAEAGGSGGT